MASGLVVLVAVGVVVVATVAVVAAVVVNVGVRQVTWRAVSLVSEVAFY